LVGAKVTAPNASAILLTAILITNTLWLIFLMLLLGYGLVMFPLALWIKADPYNYLNIIQHEAATEFEKLTSAYSNIFLCISNIQKTERELKYDDKIDQNIIDALDKLVKNCPVDLSPFDAGGIITNKSTNNTTIGSLADYREKLYWDSALFTTSQGKLARLQTKIYFLEDLIDTINDDQADVIKWSFQKQGSRFEFMWYITIKPYLLRLCSLMCVILSICSYLGAISTINGINYKLSPYFILFHKEDINKSQILIMSLITIGYLCYITTWSLFQMKMSKLLELVSGKATWPIPMSINSRTIGCLVTPLSFYYLGWLHENGITHGDYLNSYNQEPINTIFAEFYGIKAAPVIGNPFNSFFPILMLCISGLAMANYLNFFLRIFRCSQFQFGPDEISDNILQNGKFKLVERKKLIKEAYKNILSDLDTNEHSKAFFKGFKLKSKFNSAAMISTITSDTSESINSTISSLDTSPKKPLFKKIETLSNSLQEYMSSHKIQPV